MADTPEQAAVRRQLAARAEQVSTRVPAGGAVAVRPKPATAAGPKPATATATATAVKSKPTTADGGPARDITGPGPHRRGGQRRTGGPTPPVARLTGSRRRGRRPLGAGLGQAGRGGQHTLAAELLLFAGVVAIRAIAQYGPGDKSKLPKDQYGPLFILGTGLGAFFVLSLAAARGGSAARFAAMFGALIDVALLVKSQEHINAVAAEFAQPHPYTPLDMTGTYAQGSGAVGAAFTSSLAGAGSSATQTAAGTGAGQAPPSGSLEKMLASLAKQFGWTDQANMDGWRYVLSRESGGNPLARNPSSGAFGAAQALGHGNANTRCPKTGINEYGGFGLTDAQARQANCGNLALQLLWMAHYIKATYGSPARAAAFERANSAY